MDFSRPDLTEQERRDEMCVVANCRWCATCLCWHPLAEWANHPPSIPETLLAEQQKGSQ